jgi:FkbH-like protein
MDIRTSRTLRNEIERFNCALAEEVAEGPDLVLDVAWLASAVGLQRWYDERQWFWGRLAFAPSLVPLYSDFVSRLLAAVRGKSRKCLVLDLDNTLWGGVVGDDGVDELALSEGDPRGEAYLAVQTMALQLKERGIVLAICSKNDEETARAPFRSHPGMLLKEQDIAIFIANWNDKASNLRTISEKLSLGLDSMVLLDDNPAERALVRQTLPMVGVPELGDPSLFVQTVLSAGYFEAITFSQEDRARAAHYQANANREALMAGTTDMESFLRSLNMEIRFRPFDPGGRKRIAQLINKTNQFNLTTRRYTEHQVCEMEARADVFTLQVALSDQFGDNGTIGIVISREETNGWEIDTWLMSCRVLNRRVEECVCNHLVESARHRGVQRIRGRYIPTPRNGIVRPLYQKLGFQLVSRDDQEEIWQLELPEYVPFKVPIRVLP